MTYEPTGAIWPDVVQQMRARQWAQEQADISGEDRYLYYTGRNWRVDPTRPVAPVAVQGAPLVETFTPASRGEGE